MLRETGESHQSHRGIAPLGPNLVAVGLLAIVGMTIQDVARASSCAHWQSRNRVAILGHSAKNAI